VNREADFAKLDRGITKLVYWCTSDAGSYANLEGFTALRVLTIMGSAVPSQPPAGSLAPIAAMQHLVDLTLPLQPGTSVDDLRSLGAVPGLQFLRLQSHRALQVADVQALATWPRLRSLELKGGRLDAAVVRALSQLTRLDALRFSHVEGCTEDVLRELRTVHRLQRISLHSLGELPCARRLGQAAAPGAGLSVPVAKALAELPLLTEVELTTCAVSAAAIACLPARLTSFSLDCCPDAGADVVAALQRFPSLRRLGLDRFERRRWVVWAAEFDTAKAGMPDQAEIWRAQAELLRRLPVQRLTYWGPLPADVAAALPATPSLAEVELMFCVPGDVEAVAKVGNLRRLRLDHCNTKLADVQPLTTARSLAHLDLRWTPDAPRDVPREAYAALLPGVAVTVQ